MTPIPARLLRNVGTGRCLEIPGGTTADAQVQVFACGATPAQQWTSTPGGQVTALAGQKCLDAYQAGTTNGTVVGTYACNGGDNQKWQLQNP